MGTALDEAIADLDSTRTRCSFARWIDGLDDDYRAKVEEALARIVKNRELNGRTARGATAPWLSRALSADGYEWSTAVIAHHLRSPQGAGCRCRN